MESGVRDSDQAAPNDPGTLQAGGGGFVKCDRCGEEGALPYEKPDTPPFYCTRCVVELMWE